MSFLLINFYLYKMRSYENVSNIYNDRRINNG